ncbi:DUF2799 domain-containing protein [Undibacterium baiyunense]|nr:DUF2799 domain-containing protein [Undibacterium baiyunense]
MRQIKDCKQGDWNLIGNKDGLKGLPANFEERRSFCAGVDGDKIKAESASFYQAGWVSGNTQFWQKLGEADGRFPRPATYYQTQIQSEPVTENKTPLNPDAYHMGWRQGNADYWSALGDQDGVAGLPASIEAQRLANAGDIPFNSTAFQSGWARGNQAYWTRLGYEDARQGVSDKMLQQHAKAAEERLVLIRRDAYQLAWDTEIVEYWKRTAWEDATNAWDRYMRRVDAKRRDIKFVEEAYQAMWESRLQAYWRDAGKDDGFGKPQRIDERIANARKDKVFVIEQSRDLYLQAWNVENMRYCSPENAFSFGRQSQYFEVSVCHMTLQARVKHAYGNGQKYEITWREKERVERDIRYALDRRNDADYRIRQLDKDSRKDQDIIKNSKDQNVVKEASNREKRRDQERHDIRRSIRDLNRSLDDLESWRFRHEERLDQLQRSI